MNRLEKTSIHVEEGGPISRIAASTLGRVGGLTNLMLTGNALKDPSRSLFHKYLPDRFEEHKHDAELIANSSDDNREALKDTVLRLGGTNTIDDIVWKKDRGDNLPWYRRLGGRVLHNQKVSLPMRLIGMPQTLVTNAITPLLRASHYNRMSDTIGEYMHEPAVTQHELGHALDFNSLYGIKPGKGNIASKPLKGLAGDLYHASYFMIPGANLVHEARANSLSDDALKKALGANSKEYKQNAIERTRVLPAGYGSYVGALAGNPLAGIIAGRAYGSVQAAKLQKDFDEEYGNDEAPNVETNNKLKKAAAFGAMMGKRAVALNPMVLSSLAGAAVGGGGTAIYDWLKGTKENKLRRAMIGAGVGGLAGAGLGHLAGKLTPAAKPEAKPEVKPDAPIPPGWAREVDRLQYSLDSNDRADREREAKGEPLRFWANERMIHPASIFDPKHGYRLDDPSYQTDPGQFSRDSVDMYHSNHGTPFSPGTMQYIANHLQNAGVRLDNNGFPIR